MTDNLIIYQNNTVYFKDVMLILKFQYFYIIY